jgi:uncharacterized protein YegP (UPF0339 family)
MPGKFVITMGKDKKYYFNLKASNGQVILTSQGYKDRRSCMNGIDSVRKNSTNDSRFEVKASKNGQEYFVLNATNGQVIGKSQMYKSSSGCRNGKLSVAKTSADAAVVDETE